MDLDLPVIYKCEFKTNDRERPKIKELTMCFGCAVKMSQKGHFINTTTVEVGDSGNDMRSFKCDLCDNYLL